MADKKKCFIIMPITTPDNTNTLWKYFGMRGMAEPYKAKEGGEDKLDYLAMQIEALQRRIQPIDPEQEPVLRDFHKSITDADMARVRLVGHAILGWLPPSHKSRFRVGLVPSLKGPQIAVSIDSEWTTETLRDLHSSIARNHDIEVVFMSEEELVARAQEQKLFGK